LIPPLCPAPLFAVTATTDCDVKSPICELDGPPYAVTVHVPAWVGVMSQVTLVDVEDPVTDPLLHRAPDTPGPL